MGFSDLEESPPGTRSPTPDISVLRCALNPPVVGYLFHEAPVCSLRTSERVPRRSHVHFNKHITVVPHLMTGTLSETCALRRCRHRANTTVTYANLTGVARRTPRPCGTGLARCTRWGWPAAHPGRAGRGQPAAPGHEPGQHVTARNKIGSSPRAHDATGATRGSLGTRGPGRGGTAPLHAAAFAGGKSPLQSNARGAAGGAHEPVQPGP